MRIDWFLIQAILGYIETECFEDFIDDLNKVDYQIECLKIDAEKHKVIIYKHLELLSDGGFIKGVNVKPDACEYRYPRLTKTGHNLLKAMQSRVIWECVCKIVEEKEIEISFLSLKFLIQFAYEQMLKQI